jgi:hypothetical protein
MKQSVKIITLPSKEQERKMQKGSLELFDKKFYIYPNKSHGTRMMRRDSKSQHLYVTVSQNVEPIKEGDWYIDDAKVLRKSITNEEYYWGSRQNYVKIIATTDPSIMTNQVKPYNMKQGYYKQIPQLQQSFLEEFVANPDGEWEVEYNTFPIGPNDNVIGTNSDYPYNGLTSNFTIKYKLKLTQNNTIFINAVEENVVKLKNMNKELKEKLHEWYTCLDENKFELNGHTAHDVQSIATDLIDKLSDEIRRLEECQQFKITN